MIVAGAEGVLALGLSRANIAELLRENPMRLKSETHPGIPEGLVVYLFAADDPEALERQFRAAGLIGPGTRVFKPTGPGHTLEEQG